MVLIMLRLLVLLLLFSSYDFLASGKCFCFGSKGLLCQGGVIAKADLLNCSETTRLVTVNASFQDCDPHWHLLPKVKSLDIFPPSQLCKCLNCSAVPAQVSISGCAKCKERRYPRMSFHSNSAEIARTVAQVLACFDKQLEEANGIKNWIQIIIGITSTILATTLPVLVLKLRKHCGLHRDGASNLGSVHDHRDDGNHLPLRGRQQ